MKIALCALVLASTLLAACNNNPVKDENSGKPQPAASQLVSGEVSGNGKYSLKSGVIHTVTTLPKNMGQTQTTTWFTGFGAMESSDIIKETSYAGIRSRSRGYSLIRDGFYYSWDSSKTQGTKINLNTRKDLANLNYRELTEDLKKAFHITEEGTEAFLGKTCTVYRSDLSGIKTRILIWDNIAMKSESDAMGMKTLAEVTRLEENVPVPPEKFELPSTVTFSELSLPGK